MQKIKRLLIVTAFMMVLSITLTVTSGNTITTTSTTGSMTNLDDGTIVYSDLPPVVTY